uniref:Uncharacterized protein n=1 Tax=Phaeodactylum tricornutum TaxID=2850 RepID=A0A8J9TPP4_PHATR
MRLGFAIALAYVSAVPTEATFERHVASRVRNNPNVRYRQHTVENAILAKAIPLKQYEANLATRGMGIDRRLEEAQNANQGEGQQADDYYMGDDEMYSFSGYSMKFAKCQPVQYFSENAIHAGEHSPMITEDIVVLRICPQKSCSSSREYGCHYNYAEYALQLTDYLSIMLKYSAQKRDYICDFCNNCLGSNGSVNRRSLNEGEGDGNGEQQNNQDQDQANNGQQGQGDGQDNNDKDDEQQQQDQNDQQKQNEEQGEGNDDVDTDDATGDDEYANACSDWDTYCSNYSTQCAENDGTYLDYEGYLNYMDCSQADYNDYAYFVRPRCDGSKGSIKMAVYYDNYCVQYAGNEVSVKDLGLGFREGAFGEFYSGSCLDCSDSEYPPYDANSLMCNNLHGQSAKCSADLMHDLFESEEDDTSECSYIESLRFGTYDKYGQLNSAFGVGTDDAQVTTVQAAVLALSIALCVIFAVYSCYLHHTMTNLLIKSLSHRELLPPSRHQSRRPRRHHKNGKRIANADDWDHDNARV